MRPALQSHPDTSCPAVRRLEATFERPALGVLALRFVVHGEIASLLIPNAAASERTNGLWKHTCFEAFVWPGRGDAYFEVNVSPSSAWAAYAFDGHRAGMRHLDVAPPRVERRADQERFELSATFELNDDQNWQVKPTAVIETVAGELSYWAFEHRPGKPDFHHRVGYGFALRPAGSP